MRKDYFLPEGTFVRCLDDNDVGILMKYDFSDDSYLAFWIEEEKYLNVDVTSSNIQVINLHEDRELIV